MTVQELEKKIIDGAQAYYSGEPIMSDHEWDGLLEYLKAVNPTSEILTKTGWGYDPYKHVGDKESHIYGEVIGIPKKPREVNDIPKEFFTSENCLGAKLDGLSMVCYFVNGKFTKALTRGNGATGINRTDKIEKIVLKEFNLPENFDFTGAIRGEVCISNDNWIKMQEEGLAGSNQRNTAVGILNRDEILDDIKYLDLIFYKVVGYNDTLATFNKIYKESIIDSNNYDVKFLRKFIKPEFIVDHVIDKDGKYLNQESLEELYDNFKAKYPCDGIVITQNVRSIEKLNTKFNNNIAIANNEIAYKFVTESAETIIENIRWKMSKGNKAIPVINVRPVELSGAMVSNASAYNAKYIYDNDLDIGSKVELIRSGEVIPYISGIISTSNGSGKKKLDEMTCPYCNTKLEWVGVDLVCNNPDCKNRDEQNFKVWVRNIAVVDGMSEKLNFKFFEELNIDSLDSLYSKSYDELSYAEAASNTHKGKFNLVLDKLFNQPIVFKELLIGLNIKMLGDKNATKLANNNEFISLIKTWLNSDCSEINMSILQELSRTIVGEAFSEIMLSADTFNKLKNMRFVRDRIDFSYEEVKNLIPVVITGKLSVPRKEFEQFLNDNGYEVKGAVNKDIKYLITDDPNGSSSKNKKASELGIDKITENDIRDIIAGNYFGDKISSNDTL